MQLNVNLISVLLSTWFVISYNSMVISSDYEIGYSNLLHVAINYSFVPGYAPIAIFCNFRFNSQLGLNEFCVDLAS